VSSPVGPLWLAVPCRPASFFSGQRCGQACRKPNSQPDTPKSR
jgi:hypothetical protein